MPRASNTIPSQVGPIDVPSVSRPTPATRDTNDAPIPGRVGRAPAKTSSPSLHIAEMLIAWPPDVAGVYPRRDRGQDATAQAYLETPSNRSRIDRMI